MNKERRNSEENTKERRRMRNEKGKMEIVKNKIKGKGVC
jgi:hypothetical protein